MKRRKNSHDEQNIQQEPQEQELSQPSENGSGCLLRVYWMLLGNVLVAITAAKIVEAGRGITIEDVVYWLFVLSLIAARFVDIRSLDGRTNKGEPATMSHWYHYVLTVLGLSGVLWLVAHGVTYYWE